MREISVNYTPGEISTIPGHAIEMILVGKGVELVNQVEILQDRGFDNEHVDAARQSGADHFSPLRVVAGHAGFAGTISGQILLAVSFFERTLDLLRPDDGPVAWAVDAI